MPDKDRDLLEFGLPEETGVVVTEVSSGSVAASAGIRPGALIQGVNHKPIKNTDEFNEAMEHTPESGTVLMLIKDKEYSRYVAIKVE